MTDSAPDVVRDGAKVTRGPLLDGYAQFHFHHDGIAHPVYHSGERHQPPLLLMSELAGFAPGMLQFAQRLVAAGFQVYIPWMFGPFAQRAPLRNALRLCISREFAQLRSGVSAPITSWLRALTAHISHHNDNVNVGAIGMCLTGAFVIPLIIDPHVTAAVAAQPAVPVSLTHWLFGTNSNARMSALNVSDADIATARERLDNNSAHLFACRFMADRLCPKQKLDRLRHEFKHNIETHEYSDMHGRNALGQRPHATFTREYRLATLDSVEHPAQQALADLLKFLNTHLRVMNK